MACRDEGIEKRRIQFLVRRRFRLESNLSYVSLAEAASGRRMAQDWMRNRELRSTSERRGKRKLIRVNSTYGPPKLVHLSKALCDVADRIEPPLEARCEETAEQCFLSGDDG